MQATNIEEAAPHYQQDRPDLQAAFLEHFLLDREPFSLTADPEFLYQSPGHAEAIAALELAVHQGRGLAVLTGEVGTGKSTLVASLADSWRAHAEIAIVNAGILDFDEVLTLALAEFSLPDIGSNRSDRLQILRGHLEALAEKGRLAVLIIDEAQNLSDEAFEQLRLLLNIETTKAKLLQILLVGQPELRARLARQKLRHVADRIAIRAHLEPLEKQEAVRYVEHRLRVAGSKRELISDSALADIVKASGGVPRQLNILCHNALLFAFGDSWPRASRRHARLALKHAPREQYDRLGRPRPRFRWSAANLLTTAGLLLGVIAIVGFWLTWPSTPNERTAAVASQAQSTGASQAADTPAPSAADQNADGEVAGTDATDTSLDRLSAESVEVTTGDSLYEIIRTRYGRYDEALLNAVLEANPTITDPLQLRVGSILELPIRDGDGPANDGGATDVRSNPDDAEAQRPSDTETSSADSADAFSPDQDRLVVSRVGSPATDNGGDEVTEEITTRRAPSLSEPPESTVSTDSDLALLDQQETTGSPTYLVQLPPGRSLSGMIQDRYGRYTPELLELVLAANPEIDDVRSLQPGTAIRLPEPEVQIELAEGRPSDADSAAAPSTDF